MVDVGAIYDLDHVWSYIYIAISIFSSVQKSGIHGIEVVELLISRGSNSVERKRVQHSQQSITLFDGDNQFFSRSSPVRGRGLFSASRCVGSPLFQFLILVQVVDYHDLFCFVVSIQTSRIFSVRCSLSI